MPPPIARQTLVITGASSGIGLATARRAAAEGARLVMTARDDAGLQQVAQTLRERGAQVLAVPADVADREQVENVARVAIAEFGGFDTWINNAGVGLIASVLDAYDEVEARRVMDVNFWGVVHGSLAAVAHLRQRGGTLINMASMTADRAVPLQTVYSASKHAVKGFSDGLRQELIAQGAPVQVVLVKPASVGTPLIEHAAHAPGPQPKLVAPLYAPDEVARAMLHAAVHPQREVYIGAAAKAAGVMAAVAPGLLDHGAGMLVRLQGRDRSSAGSTGNLFVPAPDSTGRVEGEHPRQMLHTSAYTRLSQQPAMWGGLLMGAVAGAVWAVGEAMRRR